MHEAARVGGVERGGHLRADLERALERELLAAQSFSEVGAVDVAHREVEPSVLLARVVDRDDVRVLERGGDLHVAQEALAKGVVVREPFRGERARPAA